MLSEKQGEPCRINEQGYCWDGTYLHIQSPAYLPEFCIHCGTKKNLEPYRDTLNYVHTIAFLSLLLGPLVFIIVYFLSRKQSVISFYRCESCAKQKERWLLISVISWMLFVLTVISAVALGGLYSTIFIALLVALTLLIIVSIVMKGMRLHVKKVIGSIFYIKLYHPKVKSRFSELLKEK